MAAFAHLLAPPPCVLSRSSLVREVGTHCVWPRSIFIGEERKIAVVAASLSNLPIGAASPRPSDKWFQEIIQTLISRIDLSEEDAEASLDFLLTEPDQVLISSFLVLLRAKGVTYKEILGLAKSLNKCVGKVDGLEEYGIDVVGLDCSEEASGYISIGASVLAAAAGGKVIQKGSYGSNSFNCGRAALLEAMGVATDLDNEGVKNCIKKVGIGFVMPPKYHPAMDAVDPVRKKIKVKTVIDILGPLLHPAQLPFAVVGVCSEELVTKMAKAMQRCGLKRALIIHSRSVDVLSPLGAGIVLDITPENIDKFTFDPSYFGIHRCTLECLERGEPKDTAKLLIDVLSGEKGAIADSLILNAAAALWVSGCVRNFGQGVALARETHVSGKAIKTLNSWIHMSKTSQSSRKKTSVQA